MRNMLVPLMIFPTLSVAAIGDETKMDCAVIKDVVERFIGNPGIYPYCQGAELQCRIKALLAKQEIDNPLRQEIQERAAKDLEYELKVCELALRHVVPDYLSD